MPIVTLSLGPWVGWALAWLATWAIHGTLMLGGAWAVSLAVRSPGVRDALWKAAIVASLVTATLFVATRRGMVPQEVRIRREIVDPATPPALLERLHGADVPPRIPPWAPEMALGVWLAGALAGIARLERGRRRYWRAAGLRHAVADAESADALRRLRAAAGVERTIYLTAADGLSAPAAIGAAEICLPAAALAALTPAQRESVIAHELGHLVRRDPLWKVAVEVLAAVLWFQPLLRVAARQLAECAELLADGFAIRVTGRRRPLVEALGILAAAFRPGLVAAAGFGGSSPLVRRASRVLDGRAPAGPAPALLQATLAAAAMAAALTLLPGVPPPPSMAGALEVTRMLTLRGAQLTPDRAAIRQVAPGGFVQLVENGPVRRELNVRPGADGTPRYDYRENGRAKIFDAPARQWLADALAHPPAR